MFIELKEKRVALGLSQQEAADYVGVPKSSYVNYEYKNIASHNLTGQLIIASGIMGNPREDRVREQIEREKREGRNRHRIPNIPNFYERLDQVCDEHGNIRKGVNDEMLAELHLDLGVTEVKDDSEPNPKVEYALAERKEFADLLREFRGTMTKTAFARNVGLHYDTYYSIEAETRSTESKAMKSLVTNEYFDKRQQAQLKEVIKRMKYNEEMEI